MTIEHDSQTRIVLSWLRQDAHEDAERVLLRALDEVDATPQRRSWWPARRFTSVTNIRLAIAAAAVVIVALFGYNLLPLTGSFGGPATPAPSPTPSASPASPAMLEHAPMAACGPAGGPPNCLAPGTYRLSGTVWPGEITMEVPSGWFEWLPSTDRDAFDALLVGDGTNGGSGWGLQFIVVDAVAKDPCDPTKGRYARAETGTIDGLVAALSAWPGFEATAPVPTVVGGYSGQLVKLTSTRTETDCPNGSIWTIPQSGSADAYPMVGVSGKARAGTFRIVDVNGTLLVIRTTDFPDTSPNELSNGIPDDPTRHAADQVVMQQILDSIRITSAPAQP
jgi:hypothetical protein